MPPPLAANGPDRKFRPLLFDEDPPEAPEDSSHGVSRMEQFQIRVTISRRRQEEQFEDQHLFISAFALEEDPPPATDGVHRFENGDADEGKKFQGSPDSRGTTQLPLWSPDLRDEETFKVEAVSENASERLIMVSHTVPSVGNHQTLGIGTDVKSLLIFPSTTTLQKALGVPEVSLLNPLPVHCKNSGKPFYVIMHRVTSYLGVDFEPVKPSNLARPAAGALQSYKLAEKAISRLQSLHGENMKNICKVIVEEVFELPGYDRVMAYKFHEDDHGEASINLDDQIIQHNSSKQVYQRANYNSTFIFTHFLKVCEGPHAFTNPEINTNYVEICNKAVGSGSENTFTSGVKMFGLSSTDKAYPTPCSKAARCIVSEGSDHKFVGQTYKRLLEDGQLVILKQLSRTSAQGSVEKNNEVVFNIQLKNLFRLSNCCLENGEMMPVFEYLPKSSTMKYFNIKAIGRSFVYTTEKNFKVLVTYVYYADELKKSFYPWIDQSTIEKGQAQGPGESYVKQFSDYIVSPLVEVLHVKPEVEICLSMLDFFNQCMKHSEQLLDKDQLRFIMDEVKHLITVCTIRKRERAEQTKAEGFDVEDGKLQTARAGMDLMQMNYLEKLPVSGRHVHHFFNAASSYYIAFTENKKLCKQARNLKGVGSLFSGQMINSMVGTHRRRKIFDPGGLLMFSSTTPSP